MRLVSSIRRAGIVIVITTMVSILSVTETLGTTSALSLLVWPITGSTDELGRAAGVQVNSAFGMRRLGDTAPDLYDFHEGIDLEASVGTAVKAAFKGIVVGKIYESDGSYSVLLEHDSGELGMFWTYYTHLNYDDTYKNVKGSIEQGAHFVNSGETGAVGPHLHFAVLICDYCNLSDEYADNDLFTGYHSVNPMNSPFLPYYNYSNPSVDIVSRFFDTYQFNVKTNKEELDFNRLVIVAEKHRHDSGSQAPFDSLIIDVNKRLGIDNKYRIDYFDNTTDSKNTHEDGNVVEKTGAGNIITYTIRPKDFQWGHDEQTIVFQEVKFPDSWKPQPEYSVVLNYYAYSTDQEDFVFPEVSAIVLRAPEKVGSFKTGLDSDDSTTVKLSWFESRSADYYIVERKTATATSWTQLDTLMNDVNLEDELFEYEDKCIGLGVSYIYRILAVNYVGSTPSDEKPVTVPGVQPPSAPTLLKAKVLNIRQIELTWTDHASNETGYSIERRIVPATETDSSWVQVGIGQERKDCADPDAPPDYQTGTAHSANASSYTDGSTFGSSGSTSIQPDTTYEYRVRAFNEVWYSNYSNTVRIRPFYVNRPGRPDPFKAVLSHKTNNVSLSWSETEPSYNEEGFKIERKKSTDDAYVPIKTIGPDTTRYVDRNLNVGATYIYRVLAFNPRGTAYSDSATVEIPAVLPNPPFSFFLEVLSSSEIRLHWKDASDNEEGFRIERGLSSTSFDPLPTVDPNTESYVDTGLASGTTYYYRIQSYNSAGSSAYPVTRSATTSVPSAPENLSGSASSTGIALSWTDRSDNEAGFKIDRKLSTASRYSVIDSIGANTTAYTDYGVLSGKAYHYRVWAHNAIGPSGYSNIDTVSTRHLSAPPKPDSLTAQALSSTDIRLQWTDNSENELGFEISRRTQGTYILVVIDSVGANVTEYTDSDLSPQTQYVYRIRAYNQNGESDFSNPGEATTPPPSSLPAKPDSLTAQALSSTDIRLQWTDNSENELGFEISRRTQGTYILVVIDSVGANVTEYTDSDLSPQTQYVYRIRAYNQNGESDFSNPGEATPPPPPPAPAAPSALTAAATSSTAIGLRWTDNSDNESEFWIERKLTSASDSTYSQIDSASMYATTYADGDLQEGTSYTYRVRAHNAGGESAYSNTAEATTWPHAPTDLDGSVSMTTVSLTWTDHSSHETSYEVERKAGNASPASDFTRIDTLAADATTYSDSGLQWSTTYVYRVRASLSSIYSSYSNTYTVTTPNSLTAPAAPSALSAEAQLPTSVLLRWTDNSDNETGFKIVRRLSTESDAAFFSQIDTAGVNATTYTDNELSASTTYLYRVRAYNGNGNSGYSGTASATTPMLPTPTLSARAESSTQISLSWTDVSDNKTGFKIERRLTSAADGTFSQIGTASANDTTHTDGGLEEGTSYTYRVRAYNAAYNSSYSNSASATTWPHAPTDLDGSVSMTTVSLTWTDHSSHETSYEVERKAGNASPASDFTRIDTLAADATTYSDSGLQWSTTYTYRVRALMSDIHSSYSNTYTVTTPDSSDTPPLPAAPSALSAEAQLPTSVLLRWTDNSDNETGFKIERRLSTESDAAFSQIDTAGVNATTYTDNELSASTTYLYRVRAYNAVGNSDYSATASVTTTTTVTPPMLPPPTLSARAESSTQISLSWTDDSDDETGFKIERRLSTESDAAYSQIGTAGVNDTTHTDGGLEEGTSYTYRVRAYNAAYNSSYSNSASATTWPHAPTDLDGSVSMTTVSLTWTDHSSHETSYEVERKAGNASPASDFTRIDTLAADATTYSDSGLQWSTTYTYRVRALMSDIHSSYSNTYTVTTPDSSDTPPLPAAPSSLSASAAPSSQINLSWTDNSDDETGFKIERRLSSGSTSDFSQVGTVSANTESYTDSGLSASTGYTYRVRAYNSGGNSNYSATASATTNMALPSSPSSLSASAKSSSRIDLSWTDNSDNETGFKIERRLSSGSVSDFSQVGTASANAESYTDSGLSASTGYTYRVRAYNSAGNSGYSGTASATTNVSVPNAPFSLTATAKSSSQIDLGWKDASNNESGFKIERRLSSGSTSDFSQIGTASANAESYTNSGLSASTGYTYRVRAYNSAGNSSYSGTASATTTAPSPPSAPSGLSADVLSSTSVRLDWIDNSNDESGFKIERRLSTESDNDFSQIGTTSANDTDYTDSGLSPSTTYIYRVRAYNAGGNSSYSGTDLATTTAARAVAEIFEYALEANYPNPFREHTKIVYSLPEVADVRLELFNILGQQVRTLIDEARPPGRHEIVWDGRDDNGRMVSSGVYILRMTAGDFIEYRKMTFLK